MSACEECWAEASRRAMFTGRATADLYPLVLAENEGIHLVDAETNPRPTVPATEQEG